MVRPVPGAQRLVHWIASLGNAGAVSNAGALAIERRNEEQVVRSLRRSLRGSVRRRLNESQDAAAARSA